MCLVEYVVDIMLREEAQLWKQKWVGQRLEKPNDATPQTTVKGQVACDSQTFQLTSNCLA